MKTKKVKFSGASDDLCEVSVDGVAVKEFCNTSGEFKISLQSPEKGVMWVLLNLGAEGQWNVGVGLVKSGVGFYPLPDWPMKIGWAYACSVEIEVEVPVGTMIIYGGESDGENDGAYAVK